MSYISADGNLFRGRGAVAFVHDDYITALYSSISLIGVAISGTINLCTMLLKMLLHPQAKKKATLIR